ncbi:hypothetical protein Pmar_PMAR007068, partial [Perkinsus marinus ATCC 50983]
MAPKTKANHGASSVSTTTATVVLQTNPAKRVRNALSAIQESGEADLDSQWGHLQTAYLPETVVDAALREKLRFLLMKTNGEGGEYVDADSKLLLWAKIGEEVGRDGYDAEVVHDYFVKWLDVLKSLSCS